MKDYEIDYQKEPINFMRFIYAIGICICVIGFLFYPQILKNINPPKEEIKIVENQSYAIQIEYITVLVTPTPDGKLYFSSEYEQGIRKLKRPFSFIRENAIGEKDLSVHATIYDYREFNKYHWFNPTDYKYYTQYANTGQKYLFIFANIYSDDIIGQDVRFWIPKDSTIIVEAKNNIYSPIKFIKQLRIKELEEISNMNDNNKVKYFNTISLYSSSSEYSNTAGEYSENIEVLKGGISNAIDGYLVYEIPENIKIEDITIWWNIHNFGQSGWKLKI